jgi:beta-glucosidase/6-phospho-beta-glucosidase/beta-galactosidase
MLCLRRVRQTYEGHDRADGYTQRYGLTYVDFRNQTRTVKDSGLRYGRVAAANRLDVYP